MEPKTERNHKLSVYEMREEEIPFMVDYFLWADENFLRGMGADKSKLPARNDWIALAEKDMARSIEKREFYYLIWLINGLPCGHCNINKIQYGYEAFMHLHMWSDEKRANGCGTELVRMCIPEFFQKFQLKKLICEPYAENPAPNRVLQKLGFRFIRRYETVPGWINFRQEVNRYEFVRGQ